MTEVITRAEARARRDAGIERAVDRADREQENWSDEAHRALERYCQAHPSGGFLTEDVRAWAERLGLVAAPDNARAWGAVMQRAQRYRLIRAVGYAPARSSHLSPKVLWEAV